MTNLENVSRESLERALKDIRTDIGRVCGIVAIASGDSDFWLVLVTWIGLTHLIQANWHLGLGTAMLIGGGLVYGVYFLRKFELKKKINRFMKAPLEVDTDVDLS